MPEENRSPIRESDFAVTTAPMPPDFLIGQALDTLAGAVLPIFDQLRRAVAPFLTAIAELPIKDHRGVPWGLAYERQSPDEPEDPDRYTFVLTSSAWRWNGTVRSNVDVGTLHVLLVEEMGPKYHLVVVDTAHRADDRAQALTDEATMGPPTTPIIDQTDLSPEPSGLLH